MSDVADMLGIAQQAPQQPKNPLDILNPAVNEKAAAARAAKRKPKGMKREVFDLLGPDGLAPAAQSAPLTPAFKSKRTSGLKGKWNYDSILNSARANPVEKLKHWVKADITYTDYPYAKFNLHIDKLQYTDEEYNQHLADPSWTREETDKLVELCCAYDLRWAVIADRCEGDRGAGELMHRYYSLAQKLRQVHSNLPPTTIFEDIPVIDVEKEQKRRVQQDLLFRKTKEDEAEEGKVKEELKAIELILKKNKRPSKSSAPPAAAPPQVVNGNDMQSFTATLLDSKGLLTASATSPIAETYTAPQPGKPALQSSRLYLSSASSLSLSKNLVQKVHNYMREAGVPDRPLATQAVCDYVDKIRRESLVLLSLHNALAKKEAGNSAGASSSANKGGVKTASKGAGGRQRQRGGQKKNAGEDSVVKIEDNGLGDGQLSNLLDIFDTNAGDDFPLFDSASLLDVPTLPSLLGVDLAQPIFPPILGSDDQPAKKKRARGRKSEGADPSPPPPSGRDANAPPAKRGRKAKSQV